VRKCNRLSETYQTLEGYGELWLKMFGASMVYGENFGVHEWPLRKWRFLRFRAPRGGLKYHYTQELCRNGDVIHVRVPSVSNRADIQTKVVTRPIFYHLSPLLKGVYAD
jgi:hypothetical protein